MKCKTILLFHANLQYYSACFFPSKDQNCLYWKMWHATFRAHYFFLYFINAKQSIGEASFKFLTHKFQVLI